jgi:hypothetical protein
VSLPLKDFRLGITAEAHAVLRAYAEARGVEMQDVVRDLLSAWAAKEIHAASVLIRSLEREGLMSDRRGTPTESAGVTPKPAHFS